METSISKKATWGYLLKFSLPTIISMLLMSTFGIVDGIFVARLIDPIALSAVGIVFPFFAFVMAIGFMLGVGGNALVAKKIGAGLETEARVNFSLIALTAFILSVLVAVVGIAFPSFILNILGANDFVYDMALEYMMPLLYFLPAIILGMAFQQFLITEGKAHIITITTVASGLTSAGLNYVFIYLMDMGLRGAAIATSIGFTLPAIIGLLYFTFKRSGNLYFVKPKFEIRVLGRACINGASEMVTMLATSITSVLMNNILMRLQGPEAVAAAGIMFAAMGIFTALFVGFSSGIAPIISYNYGKGDTENLKRVYINSLWLIGIISTLSIGLAWLLTNPIISVYDVPVGTAIYDMAFVGTRILAAGFVFMGFNTFSSMWFTALNNGLVSSVLSFFRTLVFVVIAFLILPEIFGLNGAWVAMPAAELLGIGLTIFFFKKMKRKYNYA
ncbi:MAG: MATE family efflux transporter [Defluviitaleaceae bacterium]|nr:MATE family efflux transporter [Defluviitaleaceae bacterium]